MVIMANDNNTDYKTRRPSDAQYIFSPPADWGQTPTHWTQISVSSQLIPQFIYWAGYGIWNIPLVSLNHLSQLCSLPISFVSSSLAEHERKVQDKPSLEKPKTSVCYQYHSHSECKTWQCFTNHSSYWEEIKSTLDETIYIYKYI